MQMLLRVSRVLRGRLVPLLQGGDVMEVPYILGVRRTADGITHASGLGYAWWRAHCGIDLMLSHPLGDGVAVTCLGCIAGVSVTRR
jgi:hypothetical protein